MKKDCHLSGGASLTGVARSACYAMLETIFIL